MAINVLSVFVEDIERNFRSHLPQSCINILAMMAEENRTLQNAVNELEKHVDMLKKVMILSAEADRALLKSMKKYNQTFEDPHADFVKSQDIKDND